MYTLRILMLVCLLGGAAVAGEFTFLGKNDHGHDECRRERDGAVVVMVPAGPFVKRTWSRNILGEGKSILYPGCRSEKLAEVFAEFCRTQDASIVPEAISSFTISPGMFAITPHREKMKKPEDLILIPERAFPKGGQAPKTIIARLKEAQAKLGKGIPRSQWKKK